MPQSRFLCDNQIHPKLDKYEIMKFLNCHSTNLLIGKSWSVKTSVLYSSFKSKRLLKKCYENIFLFQPTHSRQSMRDKLFEKKEI